MEEGLKILVSAVQSRPSPPVVSCYSEDLHACQARTNYFGALNLAKTLPCCCLGAFEKGSGSPHRLTSIGRKEGARLLEWIAIGRGVDLRQWSLRHSQLFGSSFSGETSMPSKGTNGLTHA